MALGIPRKSQRGPEHRSQAPEHRFREPRAYVLRLPKLGLGSPEPGLGDLRERCLGLIFGAPKTDSSGLPRPNSGIPESDARRPLRSMFGDPRNHCSGSPKRERCSGALIPMFGAPKHWASVNPRNSPQRASHSQHRQLPPPRASLSEAPKAWSRAAVSGSQRGIRRGPNTDVRGLQ